MNEVNELRCLAHECIIKIMDSDDPEKKEHLSLLKMHAEKAIEKVEKDEKL